MFLGNCASSPFEAEHFLGSNVFPTERRNGKLLFSLSHIPSQNAFSEKNILIYFNQENPPWENLFKSFAVFLSLNTNADSNGIKVYLQR